ncbi:MAG: glycine--tRNA ligase [Chloroflexota bacterium]|nr:glycine--tRNA ligase [Chloroflexota bacterium]
MVRELANTLDMETIASLSKRRGFVYPSSEIYGGYAAFWDYGPVGVELKRNIKEAWWKDVVHKHDEIVGLETTIIMHPQVWVSSGHLENFTDPLVDCRSCKQRFRADNLPGWEEELLAGNPSPLTKLPCPSCGATGQFTEPRPFNTMFKTYVGPVEDDAAVSYFRPETAQGMFVQFQNVLTSSRRKLPFGIAQVGKVFRNEITTGNFIFRAREFEQMELEYFVRPGEDDAWYDYWRSFTMDWFTGLGVPRELLRFREHPKESLSHYSKGTTDLEYKFPFGWGELWGVANRTDFDLKAHAAGSGKELTYFDEETKTHIVPYVIEPALGVDRSFLVFLLSAYSEEPDKDGTRVVLRFPPRLAPVKAAVLPLSRKEPLTGTAREVRDTLANRYAVDYDDTGSIGRRYRRQDEIGTPLCVTVDFQTQEDGAVTIRDRDSMQQVRVSLRELEVAVRDRLGF